jgi:hypothetical protein
MDFIETLQAQLNIAHSKWDEIRKSYINLQIENEELWKQLQESKSENEKLQKENNELKESIIQQIDRDIAHMKNVAKYISKPHVEELDG